MASHSLFGQQNEYDFYYKIDDNQLYVRWMPKSIPDFQHAIEGKMTLELYSVEGTLTKPHFSLIDKQKMQPMPYEEWRKLLRKTPWDTLALTTVYGDRLDTEFRNQTFLSDEYGDTEEEAWFYRHGFSNYGLSYEWSAIGQSGLGYSRQLDEGVNMYTVKLFPTPSGDTLLLDINVATYAPPKVPELTAVFKNKVVELKWRTLEYRNDFFGWNLERSLDSGNHWTDIFEVPMMNDNDTIQGAGEALKYLYHTDVLPKNEAPVLYRLSGADFLGGRSTNTSEISGEGHTDIYLSPLLLKTTQTDSNYATLHWEYDPKFEPLIQEFRVIETDTTGQNYRIALEGIDATQRKASVFMKFRSNFYRVQVVSKLGTILTSFESLVMMYDVDPPAAPVDFTGVIDSSGIAHLSWVTSHEVDLAGYYLFKGYFEDMELAMITPDPLPGPVHTDTVDMVTGNEWVYYQLRSVDTRGNGSAFTPILALKKPDIYPPAAARINKIDSDSKAINLEWGTSPSPDAEQYNLYKRTPETDWKLLLSFDKDHFQSTYSDSLVEQAETYSYSINVIDDDGLESGFSQVVSLRLKDYGVRNAIDAFSAIPSVDEKTIQLNWIYNASPREYYLYKAQGEEAMSLLKVISGDKSRYIDRALRRGETYRYVLRAVFPNGHTSPFTRELVVQL